MSIIQKWARALRGEYATPLTTNSGDNGLFAPLIVKRPLLGEGNAPQYALLAQQVALAAVSGGGTLVAPFWRSINKGPTDFALAHYTTFFAGTLTKSRPLDPLLEGFKAIGPKR